MVSPRPEGQTAVTIEQKCNKNATHLPTLPGPPFCACGWRLRLLGERAPRLRWHGQALFSCKMSAIVYSRY